LVHHHRHCPKTPGEEAQPPQIRLKSAAFSALCFSNIFNLDCVSSFAFEMLSRPFSESFQFFNAACWAFKSLLMTAASYCCRYFLIAAPATIYMLSSHCS